MGMLVNLGIGFFAAGLVVSHVVLFLSRKPKREGRKLSRGLAVAMWVGVGLVVVGVAVGAVGLLVQ